VNDASLFFHLKLGGVLTKPGKMVSALPSQALLPSWTAAVSPARMLAAFMHSINLETLHRIPQRSVPLPQVNIPKTKKAFCKGCKKHMTMKVTQYKTGKASLYAQGEQRRAAGSIQAAGRCNSSSSSCCCSTGEVQV
jgi:hypothetical protein